MLGVRLGMCPHCGSVLDLSGSTALLPIGALRENSLWYAVLVTLSWFHCPAGAIGAQGKSLWYAYL